MSNKDKMYIRMKNGGGFWVDKEEYEATYAGTKDVEAERPENKWDYPGVAEEINKIEDKIKTFSTMEKEGREAYIKPSQVSTTLKAVQSQLKVVDEAIRTEGENSSLLTYRRKLRQLERKIKSGKFTE